MTEVQNDLRGQDTYVAEIQVLFRNITVAQDYDETIKELRKHKPEFSYIRESGQLIGTMSKTSGNGDEALGDLKRFREMIKPETDKPIAIFLIAVSRAYKVLASYIAQ